MVARRVDPTGSSVFFIVVGVALVGIGISQWRSTRSLTRPEASEHEPALRAKRLPPAVAIGAGLAAIVVMTVTLLADL